MLKNIAFKMLADSLKYNILLLSLTSFSVASGQMQRTVSQTLPSRQVHLDFHTSEFIPGIGEKFDKKQFQEVQKIGHVNQINIYAKCHHSWYYYPTKVGNTDPNLKFDLPGAQIEASHKIGVVCPIYYALGRSATDDETYPEWYARKKDGSYLTSTLDYSASPDVKKPGYSWKWISMAAGGN